MSDHETAAPVQRNHAVDIYRGLVMFLMLAEALRLAYIATFHPGNPLWRFLGFNQSHVQWTGMSLHDFIQPSFTFLAGVSLPYSLRSRHLRGEPTSHTTRHILIRSLILIALGVMLRSFSNITFEDTLAQIGLGYTFAYLLARSRPRWQWTAFATILFFYWLAWALYPIAPSTYDFAAVGVPPDWAGAHLLHGFAAHWNKNANLGFAFDRWFLNLFPRRQPWLFNAGGYLTLSFIPTLATMLLGVIAGRWSVSSAPRPGVPGPDSRIGVTTTAEGDPTLGIANTLIRRFLLTAAALIAIALALHFPGICPIVKRIWTPSFTLFSGGLCFLTLAAFSSIAHLRRTRTFAFPLLVIGTNSIVAYLLEPLWDNYLLAPFQRFAGNSILHALGPTPGTLFNGLIALAFFWLILYTLYRKRLFLRI